MSVRTSARKLAVGNISSQQQQGDAQGHHICKRSLLQNKSEL